MAATLEQIKELRERTGVGVNAVKEAIEATGGDVEKAIQYLREKGIAKAAKRAGNATENGTLGTYIHNNNRLVVTVEVACETDFAANSEDMKQFANDIALHIAAQEVDYITKENVPSEILDKEKSVFEKDIEGKPAEIAEKILEGKLEKFYKQNVLMYQQLFTDDSKTVEDYINELVAKLGEKIEIKKFVKMKIAAPSTSCGL